MHNCCAALGTFPSVGGAPATGHNITVPVIRTGRPVCVPYGSIGRWLWLIRAPTTAIAVMGHKPPSTSSTPPLKRGLSSLPLPS